MRTNNVVSFVLLGICAVLLAIILFEKPKQTEIDPEKNLKPLQIQNKWLLQYNQSLDKKYSKLQVEKDSLERCLIELKKSIDLLKKRRHEKVNAIDRLNNMELYKYFTDFTPKAPDY
jgi:hypothetical protein